MPFHFGDPRQSPRTVCIVARNELVSCPRCRLLIVACRMPWPVGGIWVREAFVTEVVAFRASFPRMAGFQAFAPTTFGANHVCERTSSRR
jgi:hypothetical protein